MCPISTSLSVPTCCPDCAAGNKGILLDTLPIKRGYYRLSDNSTDVRRCPDAAMGCGDSPVCDESQSGCRGGNLTSGNGLCHDGLSGVFCRLCESGNESKPVYFARATKTSRAACKLCRDNARDTILGLLGVVLSLGVAALVLVRVHGYLPAWRQEQLHYAWFKFAPHDKLKILIGFYMIATKVDDVYEVELPPQVKQLLAVFSVGVSFGFSGASTVLDCLEMRGYLAMLKLYMVTPLAIALFILLISACRALITTRRFSAMSLLEEALPPVLQLAFLAYPLVTNVAFDAFSCYKFKESQWLKADVAIQCNSPEHEEAQAYAWVAILLYPVGLLLTFATLLYAARHAILSEEHTPLSRAIAFLYREYKPHTFWWELVEMSRRFVLVGIMVRAQGSMRQLIVGTVIANIFLLFQVQASPYQSMLDDFLASAASFCLVIVFLCSYAFKDAALTGLDDIQRAMSGEQTEVYVVDPAILTMLIVASVLGAIVVSFVLFAIQFSVEGARLRREELAGKARRLRYRDSDLVAVAPSLAVGDYHIFLSHVWGTGQDQMRVIKQRLLEIMPDLAVFLDVDDLKDISDLDGYIDRTQTMLILCTDGYFKSRNCMLEIRSSVMKNKPILALLDSDTSKGGLTQEQVRVQLCEADASYAKWGFDDDGPRGEALFEALFAYAPVEWNRVGVFQDITLRLIAEGVLQHAPVAPDATIRRNRATTRRKSAPVHAPIRRNVVSFSLGDTYVQGELSNKKLPPLRSPGQEKGYHVYCSPSNAGAELLIKEVADKMGIQIHSTRSIDDIELCDHMLVYLTAHTWTSGKASAAFAKEVELAMHAGVRILLAHEMTGFGGQAARHGCDFNHFFACQDGETPAHLLLRGIYSSIAVPLKGGEWRKASMVLLLQGLAPHARAADAKPEVVGSMVQQLGTWWLAFRSGTHSLSATQTSEVKLASDV